MTSDAYTMEARLCDAAGMVSDERVEPPNAFAPGMTYLQQLNNLRRRSGHAPYEGEPFPCTGSAHLAGEHIRCTCATHHVTVPLGVTNLLADAALQVACPLCGTLPGTRCEHELSRDRAAVATATATAAARER